MCPLHTQGPKGLQVSRTVYFTTGPSLLCCWEVLEEQILTCLCAICWEDSPVPANLQGGFRRDRSKGKPVSSSLQEPGGAKQGGTVQALPKLGSSTNIPSFSFLQIPCQASAVWGSAVSWALCPSPGPCDFPSHSLNKYKLGTTGCVGSPFQGFL